MTIELIAYQKPEHGPHTIEGLLARSDPRVGKRYSVIGKRVKELDAEAEGAWRAKEATAADLTIATTARYRTEERASEYPLHDFTAEMAKAVEAEKLAKEIDSKQSQKLTRVQSRAHINREQFAAVTRYLAGRKTGSGLAFFESAAYSDDHDDPLGASAARMATLADRQERREDAFNSHQPEEVVVRTLLRQLDQRANIGAIEISGLHGERRTPSFSLPSVSIKAQPALDTGNAFPRVPDMEALACRHWRDELAAEIQEKVAAEYAAIPTEQILDADKRRKLLRSLDAEILELQREIADLTWSLIDAGHDTDFPAVLPARAILGVE
ncbi:hypothetical protein FY036_15800 [Mesorhizobium microcysteis]|uniref:Uncharacterized protein n=1 Tax=Neoaquamicrobium microcysteis TaxID=2682781 RepID=A0A5D4GS35_9HYPH|nr:hypothetical protein [Mesorhizobium microcysteis]TYR30914.1 hypothetical protein FY036_15800 [Mesorhizobium microcysteis]